MKVSDLTGAELNKLAAIAAGYVPPGHKFIHTFRAYNKLMHPSYDNIWLTREALDATWSYMPPSFSTEWKDAGPIIEREKISVSNYAAWRDGGDEWAASSNVGSTEMGDDINEHEQIGPTPLIAAMRCFVASKFGAEVDSEPMSKPRASTSEASTLK